MYIRCFARDRDDFLRSIGTIQQEDADPLANRLTHIREIFQRTEM